jgi:hypothetical protein
MCPNDVSKENDKGPGLQLALAIALAYFLQGVVYVYSRIDRMIQLLAEGQNQRGT